MSVDASTSRFGESNRITPIDRNGKIIHRKVRIKVPKGTKISGTFPEREKVAKRTYVVEVFSVSDGWNKISDYRDDGGREPTVSWVGTGGYWHDCAAAEVEVI